MFAAHCRQFEKILIDLLANNTILNHITVYILLWNKEIINTYNKNIHY